MKEEKHSTDNCYLTYSDEIEGGGYLICTYNHKAGEECLMNMDDEKYENTFQQERTPTTEELLELDGKYGNK